MEIVKDCAGNILEIGDDVVVLSSGNSSYRKGKVTGFTESWLNYPKVQVEYNDHYYCTCKHWEVSMNRKDRIIRFYKKPVKVSVDIHNVVKLLPKYLED